MIPLRPDLDSALKQARARWRRLRFSGQLAVLGSALSAALLLLGIAIWRGAIRHTFVAALLLALLLLGTGIALLVLVIAAAISDRPHPWLARRLERVHRPLQDRLNTLTSMRPAGPQAVAYFAQATCRYPILWPLFNVLAAAAKADTSIVATCAA